MRITLDHPEIFVTQVRAMIRANIEAMGFRLEDIKVLLTTQSHFDHTAALAEIKTLTGAKMMATKEDAPVIRAYGGDEDGVIDLRIECLGDRVVVTLHDFAPTLNRVVGEPFNFAGSDDPQELRAARPAEQERIEPGLGRRTDHLQVDLDRLERVDLHGTRLQLQEEPARARPLSVVATGRRAQPRGR